jgi:probable HAF family extracellular repeat protein
MHRIHRPDSRVRGIISRGPLLWLAALVASVLMPAAPACAQVYKIRNLGSLSGYADSHGLSINSLGQVVGEAHVPGGSSKAFLWLPSTAYGFPSGVNDFTGISDRSTSSYAINDLGQAVVGSWLPGNQSPRAYLWLPTDAYGLPAGMNELGGLGGDSNSALDINSSGVVAGYSYTATGDFHACVWINGTITDLDPSGHASSAQGMNDVGLVVGARHSPGSQWWQAVAWSGTSMTVLPDLGGSESWVNDANNAGQMVGTSSLLGDTNYRAALWLPAAAYGRAAGLYNIGTLPGYKICDAYSINASGVMVGWASNSWGSYSPAGRAVLWSPGGLRRADLNTLIPPGSGWTLHYAAKVTADGRIVGAGTYGGHVRAFLLTPIDLTKVTVSTPIVAGTKPLTGKITLNATAPTGGIVVALASNNAAATVPATVTVPAGAMTVSFTIKTTALTAARNVTISATLGLQTRTVVVKVRPIGVGSLALSSNEVVGGELATGFVVLECPAAPGDIVVTLSSSNAGVAQPTATSITIPAGSSSAMFTIATGGVSSVTPVTIKATANGVFQTALLVVYP